jgi:transposase
MSTSIRRGELTDAQWQRLQPLLPPQKPRVGRPALDHRTIVNAILWILRTGSPWRDLPDATGLTPPWPIASTAGVKQASGSRCGRN